MISDENASDLCRKSSNWIFLFFCIEFFLVQLGSLGAPPLSVASNSRGEPTFVQCIGPAVSQWKDVCLSIYLLFNQLKWWKQGLCSCQQGRCCCRRCCFCINVHCDSRNLFTLTFKLCRKTHASFVSLVGKKTLLW